MNDLLHCFYVDLHSSVSKVSNTGKKFWQPDNGVIVVSKGSLDGNHSEYEMHTFSQWNYWSVLGIFAISSSCMSCLEICINLGLNLGQQLLNITCTRKSLMNNQIGKYNRLFFTSSVVNTTIHHAHIINVSHVQLVSRKWL